MDDCLSAVDTKTENKILENLKKIMVDKTTIIISHRISSVKLAKKILVMDDGKVIEDGTHNELLRKKGNYYMHLRSMNHLGNCSTLSRIY